MTDPRLPEIIVPTEENISPETFFSFASNQDYSDCREAGGTVVSNVFCLPTNYRKDVLPPTGKVLTQLACQFKSYNFNLSKKSANQILVLSITDPKSLDLPNVDATIYPSWLFIHLDHLCEWQTFPLAIQYFKLEAKTRKWMPQTSEIFFMFSFSERYDLLFHTPYLLMVLQQRSINSILHKVLKKTNNHSIYSW